MEPASGVTKMLVERLSGAEALAVLTGAGVSQESGVPTFRGEEGLWKQYRAEELATWRAFESDPGLVWSWYDYRRQLISDAEPNPAHRAIAELERGYPQFSLITQNTDGLHQRAGSSAPVELHGSVWRARCTAEQTVCDLLDSPLKELPPLCERCGALLRPDVVWYGEPLPMEAYERSHEIASSCDAMLVVGTSAMVHPAASLPLVAKHNGAFVIEVNSAFTPISALVDDTLLGSAGDILPAIADRVLQLVGNRGGGAANSVARASSA
ncbi:MAG: NAD-dependent deacylase [Candidatus Eisenbacteria bacterium]